MHKRIFVPVDGNPTSVPGLNEAVELPRLTGACLMPAHPVDALVFLTGRRIGANTMNDVLPPLRRHGKEGAPFDDARRTGIAAPAAAAVATAWQPGGPDR